MCHVRPDVDSFHLARKTDIFMITLPPVPTFMSVYSGLPALFLFLSPSGMNVD